MHLERKITIPERKIVSYQFSTKHHGTVYDIILPTTQRSLKIIGLFPIKILLAR